MPATTIPYAVHPATRTPSELRTAWRDLHHTEPDLTACDLAKRLGTSEGEMVACRVGQGVIRLKNGWADLFRAVPSVGHVMALTCNSGCIHQTRGWFQQVAFGANTGAVLGRAMDLRLFLKHFRRGYAVTESIRGWRRESLQFFDGNGTAVHKIYQQPETNSDAWRSLLTQFRARVQSPSFDPHPVADPLPRVQADAAVDVAALREGWRTMTNGPHEFYTLLHRNRVTRLQALRVVGTEFAHKAVADAANWVLRECARIRLPIMVFASSAGVVQIYSGAIRNVRSTRRWLSVLDTDFSLHLRSDRVAECWVVKKPTADGPVTSIEVYDADGQLLVQFFGDRRPGRAELVAWTTLADAVAA